jgi:hypothetical protein
MESGIACSLRKGAAIEPSVSNCLESAGELETADRVSDVLTEFRIGGAARI